MKQATILILDAASQVRIAGHVPEINQERFNEIVRGDEKVMATFDCKDLTVMIRTSAGAYLILRGI